jgi:hypothetical protein
MSKESGKSKMQSDGRASRSAIMRWGVESKSHPQKVQVSQYSLAFLKKTRGWKVQGKGADMIGSDCLEIEDQSAIFQAEDMTLRGQGCLN